MMSTARTVLLCGCAITTLCATSLRAQAAPAAATTGTEAATTPDDIIVTARLRNETLISTPVTITAISGAEIAQRAINNFDVLARAVPSLIVGEGGGTVQGGVIAIRGLSGPDSNPLSDQAVSFNMTACRSPALPSAA